MGKLLLKVLFLLAILTAPISGYGQCSPTVNISSDDGDNSICAGTSVTFTAIPSSDAGSSIMYQWRINGINEGSATSSNTFTASDLQNGEVVSVRLTSDCTSAPVASNNISITVYQIPTITSITPESICGSGSVNLSATASAGTINWYAGEIGGSALSSGPNYSPNISSTTTFYVDATANGCTTATRTAVVATVKNIPTITSTTPGSVCGSGIVNLSASASSGTINWYANETGGSSLNTGPNYNPNISTTTTFYVDATDNGCTSSVRTAILATVDPTPTISGNTPGSVCGSGSVNLSATSSSGTINWYANASGGSSLHTGSSYTTPSINSTQTYYVDATDNGCTTTTRTAVTATVYPTPIITGTTPGSICGSGTVNLSATASAGTINWYAAASGGPSLGTGNNFTTPNISTTTTYYVDATENACVTGSRTAVTATVYTIPAITGTTSGSVCGNGNVNLSATSSSGTINWYAAASGGSSLGSGSNFTTPNLSSTTTYYVDASENGCTTSSRTAVVATVNSIPTITSTAPGSRCLSGSVNLSAAASSGTVNWYTSATGGSAIATGNNYTTPNISSTTSYYVDATDNGCTTGSRTEIIATVNNIPTITSVTNGSRCGNGTVNLSATASEGTINWYSSATGGTSIASGPNFSPNINSTRSYYVDATIGNCTTGTRTVVTATRYTSSPSTGNGNNNASKPTGPTSICPSASGLVYNIPSNMTQNAEYYVWNLPPGFNITDGANTKTITVSVPGPGAVIGNHNITVTAYNACGNSGASRPLVISIGSFAAVNAGPDISLCLGDNTVLQNTLSGNATNVTWQIVSGGGSISGGPYGTANYIYTPSGTGSAVLRATTNTPVGGGCPNVPGTDEVTITTSDPPAITTEPVASQTLCSGDSANFSVSATGTGLTYQWQKDGVDISGENSATLNLNDISTSNSGDYLVIVSGIAPCASVTSQTSTLVVNEIVNIATQPESSQVLCSGSAAEFNVSATGTGLSYQWQKDGIDISGAQSASYSIANSSTSDSGNYTVIISGTSPCTDITSDIANLVVNEEVSITSQPVTSQILCSGGTAEFSVSATGTGLTYQWQKDNIDIPGAQSATFSITEVSTDDTGNYKVIVTGTDPCSVATSDVANLVVNEEVQITTQPAASQVLCSGSMADFIVSATGTGLTYQWQKDNVDIPGAQSATYSIEGVSTSDSGNYKVIITGTDPCSAVTSDIANLVVNEEVQITNHPVASQTLCTGDTADFSILATVTGLSYQWQKDGVDISGANSDTYSIPNVSTSDSGNYTVVISGTAPCTDVTSEIANLAVNEEVVITSQPINTQTVCAGFPVTISVEASGTGLTYQWQLNGDDITGAQSATYNISNSSLVDAGPYTVIVTGSDPCSQVTSDPSILVINQTIVIDSQPTDSAICEGQNTSFTVSATGTDLTYEWRKDGIPLTDGGNISGAYTNTLNFTGAQVSDAGSYDVIVSGAAGICEQIISNPATLAVDSLSEDPTEATATEEVICLGASSELNLIGGGGTNETIKWYTDSCGGNSIGSGNDLSVSPTETTTYYGLYENSAACPYNSACASVTITVNFEDTLLLSSAAGTDNQNICIDNTISNITYDVAGGATSASITEGTLPDGVTGSYNSGVFTISGTATNSGIFDYTITTDGSCETKSLSGSITVTPLPSASFSYDASPYCNNASNPLPTMADGATKGIFSSTAGLVFTDDSTGEIDLALSTPGDYTVTNTIAPAGGCVQVTETAEITITALPVADFSYDGTPYCSDASNPTVTLGTGATHGIYTSTAGLVFADDSTGEIDITSSTPGSYSVTNTIIAAGGCEEIQATADIVITKLPVATFSYSGLNDENAICISSPGASIETEPDSGGTYSSTGSSLDGYLDIATGAITWSVDSPINGTHTIRYTIASADGCPEVFHEETVRIDVLPEGGIALWAENNDRLFLTCEDPSPGYASRLNLSEYTGTIAGWEYRGVSDNSWIPINSTADHLTANEIENALNGESAAFRAIIANGSCESGTYSEAALVSVIVADIKPAPVEVDKEVICIGDEITLSSETGYSAEGGKFDGGAFDNAGIKNHGWRFTNPDGGSNDFSSAANNGRADHWLRMNPHGNNPNANEKVYTSNIPADGNGYMVNFRTLSTNAGNKGFALVTGDNSSYMETPVFSLGGLDEAILTWDQAYNLTEGATIIVEISTDGGATYPTAINDPNIDFTDENVLYYLVGDGTVGTGRSGNFEHFGEGIPNINQMSINLGSYLGQSNLRLRFTYIGTYDGDVWAVDNIEVPEGPQDILLQWYYDDDFNDPDSYLEPIGEVNEYTVNFIPRKIGWNDFEVQTRVILDSNGNECQSVENFETIRVWAFDRYTTTVSAEVGSCGTLDIKLDATVTAQHQAITITEYPTLDGYRGSWRVEDLNGNEVTTGFTMTNQDASTGLDPMEDPNSIFTAENLGEFNFKWILTPTAVDENDDLIDNSGCPPLENPNNVTLIDCTTLDFDGDDDYIDLGNNYNGNYFIEAWIRPFDRALDDGSGNTNASTGVIFSSPGFEITMENLPSGIAKNGRWHHIAVANNGDLWVDGISSGNITVNAAGINNTSIGARYDANTKTTSNHFSGWIDELRIWNGNAAPDLKELRFMMNQRIQLNDAATAGSLIEGEVVPNLDMADGFSSYYTDGTHNLDQDGDKFYNQTWGDLAGYYRLVSDNPDPIGLVTFADNLKPTGGYTPDHSISKVPGRLVNITTDQENTSPTPYLSGANGTWANANTWARPAVWDFPNSSYNGTKIDWNIARINHDITSDSKEIIMLGLLSETPGSLLSINGNHSIRLTHYLLLDGNMDLVGDSQLLQDHGSILDNSSSGWAEIDQAGRMSSFNYNYWTSPFSTQGVNNNNGFEVRYILMDGSNPNSPQAINFRDGYFVADGAKTTPITISNYWIWDFRGGDADIYGDWLYLGSDYPEIAGAGFTMKGTTGSASLTDTQNYVFRGKPNNGNIPTTELFLENNQNFLVGNPYASAIDADEFLRDNLINVGTGAGNNENSQNVFNGTLYFWDHFAGYTHILEEYIGGYATYTLIGSAPAISNDWRINSGGGSNDVYPKQYIPVAQGFFLNSAPVVGQNFSGDIIFKNTQRVYETLGTNSVFLQQEEDIVKDKPNKNSSADTRMKIRVKFESPKGYYRQILVASDPNTSSGFDVGYDAPLIENNVEDMYWWFEDQGFVIQGVPDFEKERTLPLAIKTNSGGEFKIRIDETENWPSGKELYIRDKELDTIHDILKEDYIAITDSAGEITDRFEIVFFKEQAEDPVVGDPDNDPVIPDPDDIIDPDLPIIDGLVGISYSTFSKQVKIDNFDLLKVEKVMIFDVGGKLIQEFDELPNEREIRLGMKPVRSAIYIVKVFSEKGITNKKIIVK